VWCLVIEQKRPRQHLLDIEQVDGTCSWGSSLSCEAPTEAVIPVGISVGLLLLYTIMSVAFIVRAKLLVRKRLYQKYRITNQVIHVQARANHLYNAMLCHAIIQSLLCSEALRSAHDPVAAVGLGTHSVCA
jgi:hypothetical protein